ncbi:MAG: hypothetical protein AABW72_05650 [archaeon]
MGKTKAMLMALLGVILFLAGLYGIFYFFDDFLLVLKGVIGVSVALIGLLFLLIAWLDLS